jgi:cytochrome c biogenesis protein
MRTALVLLLMLAVAAIPGSVFPQRGTAPQRVADWVDSHPTIGPIADRLGLFDVFAAPWFAAIYLLLMVSLTGCVVPRTVAVIRALRTPLAAPPSRPPTASPRRVVVLGDAPGAAALPAALDAAAGALRRSRWRVRMEPGWLVASKGTTSELGNLAFHLSLLLILVGLAIGSLFGWSGRVVVREGTGFANTRAAYDTFQSGRFVAQSLPPFRFDLQDFDVTFEREGSQRGAPRSFRADLSYQDTPGAPAAARTVAVNQSMKVAGAKVFLLGHGYAPHVRITDSTGSVVFDDTVVFVPRDGNFTSVGVIKAPDAQPQLGLEGVFLPTAAVDPVTGPHSTFPGPDDPALFLSAWTGDLGMDTGKPASVFELDTSALTPAGVAALRVGETMALPKGAKAEFVGFDRWASFSVAHDPGKGLALAAAVLAVVGLSLSLLLRRRRVWVRVLPPAGSLREVTLEVSGWQRRPSDRLGPEVDQLRDHLVRAGAQPVARDETATPETRTS